MNNDSIQLSPITDAMRYLSGSSVSRPEQKEALSDLDRKKAELRDAARDFEAILIRQLLSAMSQTLSGGLFGEGTAGDIYGDFMNAAIADNVAQRNDLGLADALYRSLVLRIDPSESNLIPRPL